MPKRLKAAAGPSSDLGGDPDTEVISIPATTKVKDYSTFLGRPLMFQSIGILFNYYKTTSPR